jgi:hypothetical protein
MENNPIVFGPKTYRSNRWISLTIEKPLTFFLINYKYLLLNIKNFMTKKSR